MRDTNVDAADGGATLDNSCGYPQMMQDWFINIACSWQVPPGPTEPIRSRNRDHFLGQPTNSIGHEQRWRTFHQILILILRAPPGAYFISRYQGGSHAEWPKDSHEHAPTQTGRITCCSPKAVDTEYRPPPVARVSKRPKKLRAISRASPGRSPVGERRCGGELLPTRRTLFQVDVFEQRSDLGGVSEKSAEPHPSTSPQAPGETSRTCVDAVLARMNWSSRSESGLYIAAYRMRRLHLLRVRLSAFSGAAVHRMIGGERVLRSDTFNRCKRSARRTRSMARPSASTRPPSRTRR